LGYQILTAALKTPQLREQLIAILHADEGTELSRAKTITHRLLDTRTPLQGKGDYSSAKVTRQILNRLGNDLGSKVIIRLLEKHPAITLEYSVKPGLLVGAVRWLANRFFGNHRVIVTEKITKTDPDALAELISKQLDGTEEILLEKSFVKNLSAASIVKLLSTKNEKLLNILFFNLMDLKLENFGDDIASNTPDVTRSPIFKALKLIAGYRKNSSIKLPEECDDIKIEILN